MSDGDSFGGGYYPEPPEPKEKNKYKMIVCITYEVEVYGYDEDNAMYNYRNGDIESEKEEVMEVIDIRRLKNE